MIKCIIISIFCVTFLSGISLGKGSGSNQGEEKIKVRKFLTEEEQKEYILEKRVQPFLKRWDIGILDRTLVTDYVWKDDRLNGLLVGDVLLSIELGNKDSYGLRYYTIVQNSTGRRLGRMTARFIRPPCSLGQVRQEAVYQLLSQGLGAGLLRKGITHRFYSRDSWQMFLDGSPLLWCEGNFVGMIFSMKQNVPDSREDLVKAINSVVRNIKKDEVKFQPDRAAVWRKSQQEEMEREWKERSERRKQEDRTLGLSAWFYSIVATPERDWKWWKEKCRIINFRDPVVENRKLTCRLPLSCIGKWAKDQKIIVDKKAQGWVALISRDNGFLLVAAGEMESPDLAKGMMVRFRFFNYQSPNVEIYRTYNQKYLSDEDARSFTVFHPGKVGDFDLGVQPRLSPSGVIIPNSENAAVYFVRGTTAVMVVTTIPNISVLPVAKSLDALLLKQTSKASVPLN